MNCWMIIRLRHHSASHKFTRRKLNKLSKEIVKGGPFIFHFGLYIHKTEDVSCEKNIRSTCIYFMQGLYSVIYPLFFISYHEIAK